MPPLAGEGGVKGVKDPPRPVRSETYPQGIPEELSKMSGRSPKRLRDDTAMADLSALKCLSARRSGKTFAFEHPGRSLALRLPTWKELMRQDGVEVIHYTTCMFRGSRRRKAQVLITNRKTFRPMGRVRKGFSICDRTGLKHFRWRPTVSGGKGDSVHHRGREGIPRRFL